MIPPPIQPTEPQNLSPGTSDSSVTGPAESARIGQPAPEFTATAVVDQVFTDLKLSSFRGMFVVLLFYPLNFTFVCPTEIIAFDQRHDEFRDLNAEIVALSVDSAYSHLAWIQTERKSGGIGDINYPLVSDLSKEISRAYGVLDHEGGVALRGLFNIDPDGVLVHSTVNAPSVGRNVEEALRLVQAFRYVRDRPGEVCPANWTPGRSGLRPPSTRG